MIKEKALALTIGLLVAGCASTPSTDTTQTAKTSSGESLSASHQFIDGIDGSKFTKVSGMSCPATFEGMSLTRTHDLRNDGSDVGCNYQAQGRIFTLYVYKTRGEKYKPSWDGVRYAIEVSRKQSGFKYNKETSLACSLAGLLMAAANADNGKASSTDSFGFDAAVYDGNEGVISVASLNQTDDWFIKTRYTQSGQASAKLDAVEMCTHASDMTLMQHKNVKSVASGKS